MRHHSDDVYMTSQPIAVITDTSRFKYIDGDAHSLSVTQTA